MDNQQLRQLAAELLAAMGTVVPDPARRAAASKSIRTALDGQDDDGLRDALDLDTDIQEWVAGRLASDDRMINLAGNRISRSEVVFVCDQGHELVLNVSPLDPPVCFCGRPMSRSGG